MSFGLTSLLFMYLIPSVLYFACLQYCHENRVNNQWKPALDLHRFYNRIWKRVLLSLCWPIVLAAILLG